MANNTKDSTQAIVDFINEVKPFHTKILDVEAEYVSTENLSTNIVEHLVIYEVDPNGSPLVFTEILNI